MFACNTGLVRKICQSGEDRGKSASRFWGAVWAETQGRGNRVHGFEHGKVYHAVHLMLLPHARPDRRLYPLLDGLRREGRGRRR